MYPKSKGCVSEKHFSEHNPKRSSEKQMCIRKAKAVYPKCIRKAKGVYPKSIRKAKGVYPKNKIVYKTNGIRSHDGNTAVYPKSKGCVSEQHPKNKGCVSEKHLPFERCSEMTFTNMICQTYPKRPYSSHSHMHSQKTKTIQMTNSQGHQGGTGLGHKSIISRQPLHTLIL